jgi:hypothetical protein
VDQSSGEMQAEAQKPQNQKYNNNRPKHMNLPWLCLFYFFCLKRNGAERLPTLETDSLGAWGNQPAKRTHPL